MRARYGEQACCMVCGMDIEFHGKPRRRVLVKEPLATILPVTIVSGGWVDRGSGRFCPGRRVLHKPYR